MYRLVVCLMVVLSGWCEAAERPTASGARAPGAETSLATTWFQRAEAYAAKMNSVAPRKSSTPKEEMELSTARVVLCETYVRMGRIREAKDFVLAIEDGTPEDRASRRIVLAMALAYAGQFETAIRWAESLDTGRVPTEFPDQTTASPRDRSLFAVSTIQAREHDFSGAEGTIRRIRDPETISAAWRRLAETQAKAGQYEEATRSLARVVAVSKEDEEAKEEARTLIAKCRAEGRREPRPPATKSSLDGFRDVSALFADVALEGTSLDQQEVKAAGMTNPLNRASAWRQIAWGHFRAGDRDRCKRAIDRSLESARAIPSEIGFQRAVNELLIAALYLELGDRSAAIELVRTAKASGSRDLLVQHGLGEFTTMPLAICVFARTDAWDDAMAVVRKSDSAIGWQVLGTCLGEAGEVARADQVLGKIQTDRDKAVFCAGVTCGLNKIKPVLP